MTNFCEYLVFLLCTFVLCVRSTTPNNPFYGKQLYANSDYVGKLGQTVRAFLARGDQLNAGRARTVQKLGATFLWVKKTADVSKLQAHLDEASAKASSASSPLLLQIVIQNIPNPECNFKRGEFSFEKDGERLYKNFIGRIAALIGEPKYRNLSFAIVIEPGALPWQVLNDLTQCSVAEPQKRVIAYAIDALQRSNAALYLDAGSSGWLGWSDVLAPGAKRIAEVLNLTSPNSNVRGFSTNIANYYPLEASTPGPEYEGNENFSEMLYIEALTRELQKQGIQGKYFIIDSSRSGKQGIRKRGDQFCNLDNAGFGPLPTTKFNSDIVDATVWVKPGGESDGTSNTNSPTYDSYCHPSQGAKAPAPDVDEWFEEYAEMLVKNANPTLDPTFVELV